MRVPILLFLLALPFVGCRDDAVVTEMARQHAGDAPVPALAGVGAPEDGLLTARVVYARTPEGDVTGYLARPDTAGLAPGRLPARQPAVVVIHEWWGLNENIRAMTRRLAQLGYTALAVDLFGGEMAETPERAQQLLGAAMRREAALEENLRQAVAYLREQEDAGPVGVIGWCFGGMWALRAGILLGDELDAVVMYYGNPVLDRDQLARLEAPLLGIFGAEDTSIPLEDVSRLDRALTELGKDVTIEVYEGAGHAFANPSGRRYLPEAAEDAWRRTTAFLAEHLGGQALP